MKATQKVNYEQTPLECLEIKNDVSEVIIMLQGAHIVHFHSRGNKPLLWLSETALFEEAKAIRGGIPLCWPWFGAHPSDPDLPNHGFARTSLWKHINTEELSKEETRVTLGLSESEESLRLWPYRFELVLEIRISNDLELSLTTINRDDKPFALTQALHTYLSVEDIRSTHIEGLDKKLYYDKVSNTHGNLQGTCLAFDREIDRIYQDIKAPLVIKGKTEEIDVMTEGSHTVVIWNPGESLAAKMADLSDHTTMLCVESANVLDDRVLLEPGGRHTLSTIIRQRNRTV